jgi:DNA repair protein RAD50
MSVNYLKEKQQFKTIDTTVRTLDEYGNPTDEGSNQIEMVNVEMANAMGVSKAILNNVIFCHQEDSAWPLDEGQKLKSKFDAIFGTTEYNKAIDKILKFRKDYQEKLRLCVQEKRFLEETKNDADRKQLDFDILKTKHAKMEDKIEELELAIKPIEDRLSVLLTIEKNYAELIAERSKIQST